MGRKKRISDADLLAIAREVFTRRGLFATASEVAAAVGISEAAIFKRFPTKAALYLAAMTPSDFDAGDLVPTDLTDPKAALTELARRLLAWFRQVIPIALQVAAQPEAGFPEVAAHFGPERVVGAADAVAAFFVRLNDAGALAAPDPHAAAQLLIAAVHSLAAYEAMGLHGGADLSPALPGFVDQLWHGIAPRSSQAPGDIS